MGPIGMRTMLVKVGWKKDMVLITVQTGYYVFFRLQRQGHLYPVVIIT